MPAVAEIEEPVVAPGWSKFAGVPLAVLSVDDLRDLERSTPVTFPMSPVLLKVRQRHAEFALSARRREINVRRQRTNE